MFKYGSFKNFVVKILVGVVLFGFGLIYITSLYSYSPNDPGFSQLNNSLKDNNVANLFGVYGSYLSSYSLVFIGTLSYLLAFFIIVEGGKLFLGIKSRLIFLKFLSNLIGIVLTNVFLISINLGYFNTGLISQFFIDLIKQINLNITENIFVYFILNFLLLVFGIILIFLSFRINISWATKIFSFLKVLKYLRFVFSIFKLFKFINLNKEKTKKVLRSEPTIKRRSFINLNRKSNVKPKPKQQLDLDKFSYSLPSKSLLSKSSLKNNKSKEMDKINTDASLKLEKTLSEYGVVGKIVGFSSGPIVTLFEFVPNAGIKSSKIIGLSDDIARAMSSISARISTQPGKTSLGI